MNPLSFEQIIQYIAWLISIIELVLGLYILVLNPRHPANRNSSFVLLVIAINTYAAGSLAGAESFGRAFLPSVLLAASTPAIQPVLLIASVAILRPNWLRGSAGWFWQFIGLLAVLPAAATLGDLITPANLWYTGLPTNYAGGFVNLVTFTSGVLASPIRLVAFTITSIFVLVLLFYFAFLDRKLAGGNRMLARLLLIADGISAISLVIMSQVLQPAVAIIFSSLIFAMAYAYAGFQQMISERRLQRGSLQVRLTALILVVTIPMLVAVSIFVVNRAGVLLEQGDLAALRSENRTRSISVDAWLESHTSALQLLAASPDIISMEPPRQVPVLKAMSSTYPNVYLVSTTDLKGINLARSDDAPNTDYSDRDWYKMVMDGAPLGSQVLIGRTSGQPALVLAAPIVSSNRQITGVVMFAANLDKLAALVQPASGEIGQSFVVNDQDQVVAHPDPGSSANLTIMSTHPAVAALRSNRLLEPGRDPAAIQEITVPYTNNDGTPWRAHASMLQNGWIVVTQVPESTLLADVGVFQRAAILIVGVGSILLLAMAWFTVRQLVQPVNALTRTATGIAAGNLTLVAPVETEDEVGLLARSFNNMTAQLRELITNLERRVADRTHDLERRALQLQVTADVAREAASIRNQEELLTNIVNLISEKFSFYHAGIFLLNESDPLAPGRFCILRAASSEGGQRMLARGHRLEVGQVGIVGHVAGSGQPRIALDVGADAVFFNNPDLPQTRSEMALPLKAGDEVIGVLDVQSTRSGAFTSEDISTLQILADQIALAIENARLLTESQEALRQLEVQYQRQVARSWSERLSQHPLAFIFDQLGARQAPTPHEPPILENPHTLQVPITLRGQSLGMLTLRRAGHQPEWRSEEIELVNSIMNQVALTLDNARLLEEIRSRAMIEQAIGQITSRTQLSQDLETVIKTAVQEIGQVLGDARVQLRLNVDAPLLKFDENINSPVETTQAGGSR